jgi:hypothetical protein
MGVWVALLGPERSDEELAKIRAVTVADFPIDVFSCDDCGARKTCEFAFDAYNTDGDCLAEK